MGTMDEVRRIISEHKSELLEKFNIVSVGVFGSYVRGEHHKDSDIDLLVELKEDISLLRLVSAENFLSDLLRRKVDLVPKDDVRPELRERILREVVYI